MSTNKAASGYLKAKGTGYIPSNTVTDNHLPVVRYFKNNQMLLNPSYIKTIWNARTTTGNTTIDNAEANYKLSEIMTIFLDVYTSGTPVKYFTFSNNIINAIWSENDNVDDTEIGNIMGCQESNRWLGTNFKFENNVFKASRISSVEWGYKSTTDTKYSSSWLFPIQISPWGPTSLHVRNNKFYTAENETINFYVSRYTKDTQKTGVLPKPDNYIFENNNITTGSSIRTTTLCTSPWGSLVTWENIKGTL